MSEVTYTDTVTVQLLKSDITDEEFFYAEASFEVTAPISAWLDHTDPGFTYVDYEPDDALFYLDSADNSPAALDNSQWYLLRGALETLAEMGWEAYTALLDAGVDHSIARAVLPSHFMLTRTVKATGVTLLKFVDKHRTYQPGSEVAIIAGGYIAHLAEAAPKFLTRSRQKEGA